jgi:hypothetical protein
MRSLFVSLIVAALFMVIALVVAALGAVGVALIGLLLHRWFDLTQWQGAIIALVIASGLTLVIYRLSHSPFQPTSWGDEWEEEEEEEEEEGAEPEEAEPPIVPWRRSRPTPGELPSDRSSGGSKSARSSKPRK